MVDTITKSCSGSCCSGDATCTKRRAITALKDLALKLKEAGFTVDLSVKTENENISINLSAVL